MTTLEAQMKTQRDFALDLAQRWRDSFERANAQADSLLEMVTKWQKVCDDRLLIVQGLQEQLEAVKAQRDRLFVLLDRAHQRADELIALIEEMEPEE